MRQHLIFFGNELHGDDGFAPMLHRLLTGGPVSPDVHLYDAATRGLDALNLFQGCDRALIIDTHVPNGSPGRLYWLKPEEIEPEPVVDLAGHGAGVGYLLHGLRSLGERLPEIRILAVEAERSSSFRIGLSTPVAAALAPAAEKVREWLGEATHD
ncbi:MAG: hydrogenase maturation protease [Sedimenticola sp.]